MTTAQFVTSRLVLRKPGLDDADTIVRCISDADIVRNLGSLPWPYGRTDAVKFVERCNSIRATDKELLLAITSFDVFCGIIRIGPREEGPYISYWIGKESWGRGFASEALAAVIPYYFKTRKPEVLFADYFADNEASARILKNFGFEYVAENWVHSQFRGGDALEIRAQLPRKKFSELH